MSSARPLSQPAFCKKRKKEKQVALKQNDPVFFLEVLQTERFAVLLVFSLTQKREKQKGV